MDAAPIVLVDAGNSRVKLGWVDPATGRRETQPLVLAHGQSRAAERATQDAAPRAGQLRAGQADLNDAGAHAAWLAPLAPWLQSLPAAPAAALGVNVAGESVGNTLHAALARHGCRLQWQQSVAQALGLANGYADPARLGADRWAGLLGLRARLQPGHGPALLASFGTATTVDLIGPDDVFPGGLILPGPALMLASLAHGTANLPLASGPAVAFPVDTQQAIASGVAAAQAGAILRQWLAAWQRYGAPAEVYACGGGWSLVADETRRLLADAARHRGLAPPPVHELAHPVLDGLAALAGKA